MIELRMITRRACAVSVAACAAAWLAACSAAPIVPEAAVPTMQKVNRVEWQMDRHEVRFDLGADRLAPGEFAGLDRFLAPYYDETGLHVYVDAAPEVAGGAVASRRAGLLGRYMAERGFSARPMAPDAERLASRDPRVATVYVGRFVAVAPDCPDWRKDTAADFTNTGSSNFGCADAVNFGLMLADPGDLVRGRMPGSAEGERLAIGVRRYREGASELGGGAGAGAPGAGVSTTGGSQ